MQNNENKLANFSVDAFQMMQEEKMTQGLQEGVNVEANSQNAPPEKLHPCEILRRTLLPVLEELQEAGYAVDSVYDLVRIKTPYKTAIPILLKWLPRVNASDAKENIIDRLAVPYAKPGVARPLIEEFLKAPDVPEPKYKMRIAEALRIIADEEVYDDMVAILRDKRHGGYRTSIAEALGHMKNPGAVDVLIEMLSDEEIGGHAIAGLRALKDPKARPFLEPFLTHKEYWWRKEAAAAIKAIDKKIEREKAKETHV